MMHKFSELFLEELAGRVPRGVMGYVFFIISQAAVTSMALGGLKHYGVITVDSRKIKNTTARKLFNVSMGFGEDVVVRLESLWADLTSSADK